MEEERGEGGDTFLRSWGEQSRIYVNSKARGKGKVENEQSPELLLGWVSPFTFLAGLLLLFSDMFLNPIMYL